MSRLQNSLQLGFVWFYLSTFEPRLNTFTSCWRRSWLRDSDKDERKGGSWTANTLLLLTLPPLTASVQWKISVLWHVGRVLSSMGCLQTLYFFGHKPTPKACLPENSHGTFSWERAQSRALVQEQESLSLALFLLFDPLPWSLFRHAHHQPHESLPQQLKSCTFCPSWWEKSLSCDVVKIFQVFYYPEKDHRKTPHNFSTFRMGSLQLYYADPLCVSFYFIFYSSHFLLSFFPFAHLSSADHRGQTDWKHVCK